jgi:hypothetical protein
LVNAIETTEIEIEATEEIEITIEIEIEVIKIIEMIGEITGVEMIVPRVALTADSKAILSRIALNVIFS